MTARPFVPDDDLFSLDFTAPGALPTAPPEPPPAPKPALELVPRDAPATAPAAAPAAPAVPSAPAKPEPPAELLEAVDLHAAGDYLSASKKLEALLRSGKMGPFADTVWRGLFEVLNDLQRRDAFDKLALTYAQHCEKSPPAWIEVAPAVASTEAGEVLFAAPAVLDARIGPLLKEIIQRATSKQVLVIDVSAVTSVDDAGATLALRAIKALRDAKRQCVVVGAEVVAKILGETLEPMNRAHEPQWLLLIAMFDSLNDQAAFEDAAVNYAVTFEVSPPSWENRDRSNVRKVAPAPAPTANRPLLDGEIHHPCPALTQALSAMSGRVSLDAASLRRIERPAAQAFVEALRALHGAGASIVLSSLPPLPMLLLQQLGADEIATLQARKA